jgi:hypothetical protein
MTTRWTAWYHKGAGAFGAGYVPVGYETAWGSHTPSEASAWTDWYWKGAGAFGAGYVPVGYETEWNLFDPTD